MRENNAYSLIGGALAVRYRNQALLQFATYHLRRCVVFGGSVVVVVVCCGDGGGCGGYVVVGIALVFFTIRVFGFHRIRCSVLVLFVSFWIQFIGRGSGRGFNGCCGEFWFGSFLGFFLQFWWSRYRFGFCGFLGLWFCFGLAA